MASFDVADDSFVATNFRWAFQQKFLPWTHKPSKTEIAKKVLNSIGKSGVNSVKVGEEFTVNLWSGDQMKVSLSFQRLPDDAGDSDSAVEIMRVASLDYEGVQWTFTKTQIISSVVKGSAEGVGAFMHAVGRAFHLDDIKGKFDKMKQGYKDNKEALKKFANDPIGSEQYFKDSDSGN